MWRSSGFRDLTGAEWPQVRSLYESLIGLERKGKRRFPDLWDPSALVIASDYGGQHSGAGYTTYGILVTNQKFARAWNAHRLAVRAAHLADGRTLCYKDLNNDKRARLALSPFLSAADQLEGLLLTIAVNKDCNLIGSRQEIRAALPEAVKRWKPDTLRKALTVGFIVNFLVAALAREGQDVVWVTDRDDIVPNQKKGTEMVEFLGRLTPYFGAPSLGHLTVLTTGVTSATQALEDAVSIPDMAAGAAAEFFSALGISTPLMPPEIALPMPGTLSGKTRSLVQWLASPSGSLVKVLGRIRGEGDALAVEWMDFTKGILVR